MALSAIEVTERQGEIIRIQSEIIDSLFARLCLLCAAGDMAGWHELDAMGRATGMKKEVDDRCPI